MIRALLAGWRVSLRRTLADWPIVAAAWLITLLAAVLLAAGAIYPSAASEAGLRRALVDAPVADANVDISVYGAVGDATAADDRVQTEVQRVIAPVGGSIVRDWRASTTLALPTLAGAGKGDQAVMGFLDGLPDHATLVAGAWPVDSTDAGAPIEVVLVETAATQLGVHVGDELGLVAHPSTQPLAVPARVAGIFSVTDPADPYWTADAQLLTGVHETGQYRIFGPFLTTENDLLVHSGATALRQQWHVFPDFEQLTVDSTPFLRAGVAGLRDRLRTGTTAAFDVASGLPDILGDAERSLLVSRTGVLLLMAQLALLAAYAVVLTASLLVDHRRIETALLRSRGAGAVQVALLALAEGLLFAVPAVLVAPWLAVGALNLLNVAGPLAEASLQITPRVSLDGYIAAAAAGIVCVALLVLPAALAARGFASEQSTLSRQETRTFGQRMGLDVALLAITGIALWQLRLYGAPLTRTVQGGIGLDPLLVAAPAIGLVAGGVLALRLMPLLAHVAEAAISRGRDLVGALGSRQLARRPLRYTRSALLLMLAMSMGVFALSYAATWSSSQRDQAEYQAGADIRVKPGGSLGGLPVWALPAAYDRLSGMAALSPAERISDGIEFAASGSSDLLAIDADKAAAIVRMRADTATQPLAELMPALRAGRPEPVLAGLPDGSTYLRVLPRFDVTSISRTTFDPDTGEGTFQPIDPNAPLDIRFGANAIVRDGHGVLYRLASPLVRSGRTPTPLDIFLEPPRSGSAPGATGSLHLVGPLTIVRLGVDVWLDEDVAVTQGIVGVASVAAGPAADGPWTPVPLDGVGAWGAEMRHGGQGLGDIPKEQTQGTAIVLTGSGEDGIIFGIDNGCCAATVPAAQLAFVPESIATWNAPVPVIANRAFAEANASAVGDTVSATVEGRGRLFTISAVVDSFPTTDQERPLMILDEPTLAMLRLVGSGDARNPDEWWMSAVPGSEAALTSALREKPIASAEVVGALDRARSLSTDPVALGIIGALTLGFVATGLFALVGLTVSAAVSARQRRTEFALLRALGLSGRQLSGSLWLENGSVVFVSLVAGTILGLVIGWVVLPFVTVTQRATTPVPPVLLHIPWDSILVLEAVSAVALGIAVVVIGAVLRRIGVGSVLRMGED
jgi:ABC-type lipoprotein release transport system permease subunit